MKQIVFFVIHFFQSKRGGRKMSELQERRYKEVEPKETVKRIKKILQESGIEVEESWSKKSSVGTYSLRVHIKGTDMGQNGKGMTKEFAMASGYAEFLERLQNGVFRFRVEEPTKELPFRNFPDEKKVTIAELMEEENCVLENICKVNGQEKQSKKEKIAFLERILHGNTKLVKQEDMFALPYYSIRNKKIEYVPDKVYNYLFSSNGMCAGNSPEEAIIEGLSEILERYVGVLILKERLVLPQISETYLVKFPKVQEMLAKLKENTEYEVRLVDCSLGGKYPVAGLYLLEKNTGRFGFKLGAHPDYGIAMERCFTEAAQGRDIYEYAHTCLFDFYEQDENENKNLTKFIQSDLSAVPYQILGEKPNYEFTEMPDVSELDNKTILQNLIRRILDEKADILIRNVSTLGFPTFSIAIPGMSEIGFDPECKYLSKMSTVQELLKDMRQITQENISEVVKMLEEIVKEAGSENLSGLINLKDYSVLPCEQMGMGAKYLLAVAYIMNHEYNKAAKVLEDLTFLADSILTNPMEKILVKAVYYYASAMDKLNDHTQAMYYIHLLFEPEIAEAMDKSFQDSNQIIQNHYGITKEDYVENDDSYYLPFMKHFREKQRDNVIDQMENAKIFEK